MWWRLTKISRYETVTLTNKSLITKTLEITDYAEVVGLPHREDYVHPAFGNLLLNRNLIKAANHFRFVDAVRKKNQMIYGFSTLSVVRVS